MTDRFTDYFNVTWGDYRRAMAAITHYANKFHEGVDAVILEAAETGRARPLFVAMLDLNEALMPQLGDAEMITKLQELAATWAAKDNDSKENDDE